MVSLALQFLFGFHMNKDFLHFGQRFQSFFFDLVRKAMSFALQNKNPVLLQGPVANTTFPH
jgi:hypothetical protein